MRMIAARQTGHPGRGQRVNPSQAFIRSQARSQRILEKMHEPVQTSAQRAAFLFQLTGLVFSTCVNEWRICVPRMKNCKGAHWKMVFLILSESISMKSTWSTATIPSWEANGSGTKCSGWRLFVRQTAELALKGVAPHRPMAQVNTSLESQKCQKHWQSYSTSHCTSSASCNSLQCSEHRLLNRLAIKVLNTEWRC